MKKIFLFALLASFSFATVSCSSDDSTPVNQNPQTGGTVSFKFNGTQKTFNTVVVDQEPQDGEVWLNVVASPDGSSSEMISFNVYQGDLGSDKIMNLEYIVNDNTVLYNFQPNAIIQVNSNNTLSGTFSGMDFSTGNDNNITEGNFTIVY